MRFKSWQVPRLNSRLEARALRETNSWRGGLEKFTGTGGERAKRPEGQRQARIEPGTSHLPSIVPRLFLDCSSTGGRLALYFCSCPGPVLSADVWKRIGQYDGARGARSSSFSSTARRSAGWFSYSGFPRVATTQSEMSLVPGHSDLQSAPSPVSWLCGQRVLYRGALAGRL